MYVIFNTVITRTHPIKSDFKTLEFQFTIQLGPQFWLIPKKYFVLLIIDYYEQNCDKNNMISSESPYTEL